MKPSFLLPLVIFMSISGCTKSIFVDYETDVVLINNNFIKNQKLAVYAFEDQRYWVDSDDIKSTSFVAQQGPWKFGLGYQGKRYQSISAILQDIFVKEFQSIDVDSFQAKGSSPGSYTLNGKILTFEFANETGFVTITSKRHVSLQLTLNDPNGEPVFLNEVFNEIDKEDEGLGILHSTNVDKLMQGSLKKVVVSVVNRFNDEIAKMDRGDITVTFNGLKLNLNGPSGQETLLTFAH